MIKTYRCPVHGEFDHECSIGDEELKQCPQKKIESGFTQFAIICNQPATRVYKPVGYAWKCDGFAGRGFDVGK